MRGTRVDRRMPRNRRVVLVVEDERLVRALVHKSVKLLKYLRIYETCILPKPLK